MTEPTHRFSTRDRFLAPGALPNRRRCGVRQPRSARPPARFFETNPFTDAGIKNARIKNPTSNIRHQASDIT